MSKKTPQIRFKGFTDDWEERKLGKVFDTITDYVANGSFESLRKNVNSSDINGFAYLVRLQDASNNWQGPWLYTDQHGYEFLKKSRLQPDDIIMANVGSVGKFFLVPKLDKPMTLAPNAVLIKSSENDQGFLYQMMLTSEMQYKIFEKTTPGAQSKINKTDFKMIETRMPNIEEQQKVGSFFKQLDNTIDLHQRKLDLLKEQKKGFLQKMFPKNGAKVPELRFAGFGDDWGERKLGDISRVIDPHPSHRAPVATEKGIPFIGIGDVDEIGNINYKTSRIVDEKIYDEHHNRYDLSIPSIGIGRVASLGKVIRLRDDIGKYAVSPTMSVIQFSDTNDLDFLYANMNTPLFQKQFKSFSNGSTRQSVGIQDLRILLISLPNDLKEQQKIGSFFKQLDNTIALHQRKLDLLKEQKKGFLQKMFVS